MIQRAKAIINGIVQGVGFRPFIYHLAQKRGLGGYIANTSTGVDIEVEGEPRNIKNFFREVQTRKPPLARITHMEMQYLPPQSYRDFVIRKSHVEIYRSALVTPDMSVCEDCLQEMNDPGNRRYRYPFINCTNCGPRYTIINDIPYDREKTSMASFSMCEKCRQEYEEPADRRFHAQPIACWECGPNVRLHESSGKVVKGRDPIAEICKLLRSGKIIAVKGLGGFHLAVDATDGKAVERLRERKNREEKPLALMSPSIEEIAQFAHINTPEAQLLESPERPIVLLRKKFPNAISPQVAPRNCCFGVMLPYTPLHSLILQEGFLALVLTSGNISEEPIAIDNGEAFRRLSSVADYFLVHNRDIYLRNDDSVVRLAGEKPRMIRRSRGYAPVPVHLNRDIRPTLACGPFLANTVCLGKGNNAFLSQHVGDLENLEAFEAFERTINHLKVILEIDPQVIAYDLHPDYVSTQYATKQTGVKKIGVQHHHAHIASCMAEHGISGPVIGLAMDGTGYGTDGTIWGGEILLADFHSFKRVGHFQNVSLPGGEAAVREPWRMALAYLSQAFEKDLFDLPIEFVDHLDPRQAAHILTMIEKNINSPQTSSCGRLFDGVSALLGLRDRASYRGQAAVELEMEIGEGEGSYSTVIGEGKLGLIIPHIPIIRGVVSDLVEGVDRRTISRKFHNTLVRLLGDACVKLRHQHKLNRIVLSGGVFQNVFLLGQLEEILSDQGFTVYTHSSIPTNDGGISLGQVMVANAVLDGRKSLWSDGNVFGHPYADSED
jgi:hydrogenase maturation protein HypF